MNNKHDGIQPATEVVLITKNDSTTFARLRGISFHTAGILRVDTADSTDVSIPSGALAAGVIHPIAITRIYSTTTTADGFVGYR